METVGLPAVWLDETPYSIWSVDEFEGASGVTNAEGIRKANFPCDRRIGSTHQLLAASDRPTTPPRWARLRRAKLQPSRARARRHEKRNKKHPQTISVCERRIGL